MPPAVRRLPAKGLRKLDAQPAQGARPRAYRQFNFAVKFAVQAVFEIQEKVSPHGEGKI
jgi:hypothetical protein